MTVASVEFSMTAARKSHVKETESVTIVVSRLRFKVDVEI